ncbi:hypothetical protein G6F46_005477 [Rhizopus delemar]|uniref:Protein SYM1 n=2 Tax=Rhizopus TaxID=4842 RepID=A0A9P6Z7D7_9FUNG|nr:hypothetical protein G6F43_004861 [Rhizopus delemar]KAG1548352.1 hypothetical protein G6F51_003716 [Rhizopus arrhizus]KAG1459648.1 hypothetical protein G6F55_004632 [Rhizopus delemar]KAG1494685.1 hypothetical protein G6F54_007699 [Rhizopus delemar]KAG1506716.1 hypothetical protein G6F53_009490 [Rhizopus delemar]
MNSIRALNAFYNKSYSKRPILTLCVTNGILGAISDTLAQSISFYEHSKLDPYLPEKIRKHEDLWPPAPRWDFARTFRFAAYNFCVAPFGGKWYMFLDRYFPMPASVATAALARQANQMAIKRMVTDQALFAPTGLVLFFTVMGLAETGNWEGVREKFRDAYLPALIANYKVWPAVQFINFKFMPLQYRLPFVSSLGILWNAYLSWLNNASKQEESVLEKLEKKDTNLEVVQSA